MRKLISSAKYVKDYVIEFELENGKKIKVDFYPFIRKSGGIFYSEFLDIHKFKKFTWDSSGVYWGNAMDFSINYFYKGGKITAPNTIKIINSSKKWGDKKSYKDAIKYYQRRNKLVKQVRKFFKSDNGLLDLKYCYVQLPKNMNT